MKFFLSSTIGKLTQVFNKTIKYGCYMLKDLPPQNFILQPGENTLQISYLFNQKDFGTSKLSQADFLIYLDFLVSTQNEDINMSQVVIIKNVEDKTLKSISPPCSSYPASAQVVFRSNQYSVSF